MDFIINEQLKVNLAGIYKITFDTGFFYIGSSACLNSRIKSHCRDISNGFKINKSLKKMIGFDGVVNFDLITYVDLSGYHKLNYPKRLFEIEYNYIKLYENEKMLLNNPRYATGRVPIGGAIPKKIKEDIKSIAKSKNVSVNWLMEDLIILGLKYYK